MNDRVPAQAAAARAWCRAIAADTCARVPARVRRLVESDPDDVVIAIATDGRSFSALPARLNAGTALSIEVPLARVFRRRLNLPTAAWSRLDEVMAVDLERSTPFMRASVLTAHRIVAGSAAMLTIEQLIVKRVDVAPALDAARARGFPIKSVRIADGADVAVELLAKNERSRSRLTRRLQVALRSAAVMLAVAATGLMGVSVWRLEQAAAAAQLENAGLAASIAALRRQTESADQALREARHARERRLAQPPAVGILDDLTRRLPATTWLTDLRIEPATIAIEGFSADAAELVGLLSRSPHVATAAFSAPITRDGARSAERFQIRMTRAATKVAP